jgi:hypothetical protein
LPKWQQRKEQKKSPQKRREGEAKKRGDNFSPRRMKSLILILAGVFILKGFVEKFK